MTDDPQEMRIMAFLDGAMDAAEAEAFERELAHDAALAEEVARLAGNEAMLRAAYAAPIDQGVDPDLLARMGLSDAAVPIAPIAPNAVPAAANDDEPWWRGRRGGLGLVIAASLALVATFGLMRGGETGMAGFGEALDRTPSGQIAMLDGGAQLRPVLSFQAADGRWCREFALSGTGAGRQGVACHGGGGWQVEAIGRGDVPLPDADRVVLAAGADGQSLDAAYRRLGADDPLPHDREQMLIAKGWPAGK